MDKLDELFSMQKQLDSYIAKERVLDFTKEQWLQKRTLALIDELSEMLNEINYKWWKNPKPINEKALKEELVDVLHFFLGMCIDAGLCSDELYQIYIQKNQENFDRQNSKSQKSGYELNKS